MAENHNISEIYNITYKIKEEEFRTYGIAVGKIPFERRKTRTVVTGAIETMIAILLNIYIFTHPTEKTFVYVLAVSLLFLGIYSMVFYILMFPRILTKSITEQFKRSEYLKNEITLLFYSDRIVERSMDHEGNYFYNGLLSIWKTGGGIALNVGEKRTLLVPSSVLAQTEGLEEFIRDIAAEYSKEYKEIL